MRLFRRASLIATSLVVVAAVEVGLSLPGWTQQTDLVDTAVSAGSFNTLAKALTEAGLVETLRGPGPFTVFAPTDEAFAKLTSAKTIQGQDLRISTMDGVKVNQAKVIKTDVVASNGVIHVIDAVVLPN